MQLSIVGLGKLGSPLAAVLASKGHDIIGIDLNEEFVRKINEGIAPVEEPGLQELISANRSRLRASLDFNSISDTNVTFIIVPTPSLDTGFFTNQYILQAIQKVGAVLREKSTYHLVVITSTVMPGSTGGVIREALEEASGRKVGKDLGLCYSPEFIALGSVIRDMLFPDMLLIGESDSQAGDLLQSIYKTVCQNQPPVQRMNFVNAELTKLAVNTFITTKISYANMLADICDYLPHSDVDVVTQAVGLDSRIGRKYLKGAVAFGGPCFPRDNFAFKALADHLGTKANLAEATQELNDYQNDRLLTFVKKYSHGKTVGILGLSYKPGTNVIEKSPGISIAKKLAQEGFQVTLFDPLAGNAAKKELDETFTIVSSLKECIQTSETVLIMTNWPEFSQEITPSALKELQTCQRIIDCWRILEPAAFNNICEIIHLGNAALCDCAELATL
jgi:UDPglucose 6-dehydrogenase